MIVDDSLMFYYTGQWNFATARKLTHAAAGEDFGFCVSDLLYWTRCSILSDCLQLATSGAIPIMLIPKVRTD